MEDIKYCGAVIVAAGTASRMGGIDKIMTDLCGVPVIARTVSAFENCDDIRQIVVVTRRELIDPIRELCKSCKKLTAVVVGGASRRESVEKGLDALSPQVELAAIQDGARPLVSEAVICRTVAAANACGAAAPAVQVKDTVKQVRGSLVTATPDRSMLRAVQTPQIFSVSLLRRALKKAALDAADITDDCSAVERLGYPVTLVAGDERNIKITTPVDLKIAELLLEEML